MRVKFIKNEWLSKKLAIVYKGNEYFFSDDNTLYLDIDDDDRRIFVKNSLNTYVIFNGLDILLDIFMGDSLLTRVECDYSFVINSHEGCEITINRNIRNIRDNIEFCSLYAISETAELSDDTFYPKKLDKAKRKHRKRCWYIMSGLPLYIIFGILSLLLKEEILIAYIFVFLFFTISSIRERSKFKKYVKEENIKAVLSENVIGYRTQDDYDEQLKTKSEKFLDNFISKLFK